MNSNNKQKTDIEMNVTNTFTDLWRHHFIWLNELIINIVCNFIDLSFIIKRRNDNILDFTNELQKYYGYNKSKIFGSLLNNHIEITTKLIKDIKTGDTKSAKTDRIELYKNADEIAIFLASINPYWSKQEWQSILYDHINYIEKDTTSRIAAKCNKIYLGNETELDNHMLKMANYMAAGIIKQFNI